MHPLKLAVKIKYIKNPFLYWSFYPHSEKKFLLLKKQTSDLSPPTFNPSNYRNKSNKPSKHPTAFEGVCFFKSNKFFLSVLPHKQHAKTPFQLPNKKLHNTKSFTYSTLKILNNHINLKYQKMSKKACKLL